jgi:ABC-type polysaccharide/polyol phosphate export permease
MHLLPPSSGNPYRWTGNVFVLLAAVLVVALAAEWATGWQIYCWARGQMENISTAYGLTFGFAGFLAAVFRRFKLAIALVLPVLFPVFWDVAMREIGVAPVCMVQPLAFAISSSLPHN